MIFCISQPFFTSFCSIFPTLCNNRGMEIEYKFWKRIDLLRKDSAINTLDQLAVVAGMKGQRIREQRSKQTLPKAINILAMAKAFGVSMEYLLIGESSDYHQKNYSKRIEAIAEKLCNVSETDLSLIERSVELLPLKEQSAKVNVG